MPAEFVIIAFVTFVMLCMAPARHYFLIAFAGAAAIMLLFKHRYSKFADGDMDAMKLGSTLEDDGEYIDFNAVSSDLDSGADIDQLLNVPVTNGDDLLSNAMTDLQKNSKTATLNRARFTSDNFRRYFQEELDEAEKQHWWEDDSLVAATVKNDRHHESDDWTETDTYA